MGGKAWLKDSMASATRNLKHRKVAKKGNGMDLSVERDKEKALLLCPGLVYMLKPRANGHVHMVTTKRGGLGEAFLWQLHDILISKSMLAHHALPAYVHCLD